MATTGGRIPPDGRPSVAPGIGKTARRHDLEAQPTPGLEGSDLQYGDVQRLEQAQSVAPIRNQPPARPGAQSGGAPGGTGPSVPRGSAPQAPDPVAFAMERFGNTMQGPPARAVERVDTGPWLSLLRPLANAPRASGVLRNTMVTTMGRLLANPTRPHSVLVDLDQMDEDLEAFANGLP